MHESCWINATAAMHAIVVMRLLHYLFEMNVCPLANQTSILHGHNIIYSMLSERRDLRTYGDRRKTADM